MYTTVHACHVLTIYAVIGTYTVYRNDVTGEVIADNRMLGKLFAHKHECAIHIWSFSVGYFWNPFPFISDAAVTVSDITLEMQYTYLRYRDKCFFCFTYKTQTNLTIHIHSL